jgi:ankyrin repeat domain-containing protein 13
MPNFREGVFSTEMNEIDVMGRTPLEMAVRLGREDWVKVLWNHQADPKHRPFWNSTNAIEIAAENGNFEMVRTMLYSSNQIKQENLERHKTSTFDMLESIPDFEIDMEFECKSTFIPLFGSFAPSDTFRIYKKGSHVRLDFTLKGYKNLISSRGNMSILFTKYS